MTLSTFTAGSGPVVGYLPAGQQVDIKTLKRAHRFRAVLRFGLLVVRLWWVWARLYPRQADTATTVAALSLLVVPVLLPASVLVFGAGLSWHRHRTGSGDRFDRAVAGSVGVVFAWRFPTQCHLAELDRLIRGRQRVPRILPHRPGLRGVLEGGVQVDGIVWSRWGVPSPERIRFDVAPLSVQRPDEWPEIARRIQTRFGFATHSQVPLDENTFRVAYSVHELDALAPFPGRDWAERARANPNQVELGVTGHVDAASPFIWWELDRFPHLMINGKTGSGKSTPVRCVQALAGITGAEQVVFSGKKSGEFGWLRTRGLASVVSTPPGWAVAGDWLWLEFDRRQQLLEDDGVEHWWEHPDIGHRIFIIVDELMLVTGAVTKDDLSGYRSLVAGRLTDLAAASRSCGMHLVLVTQYGIAQSGGASGSLMRFNMSGRIVVGASNPDGLRAAFDGPVDDRLASHLSGTIRGRCLYAHLNDDHGQHVTPGQLYLLTQDDAQAVTPPEPAHPVTDFDELGAQQLLTDLEQQTRQPATGGRRRR